MSTSRWLRITAAAILCTSCSSAEQPIETVATNSEAITSACTTATIGLPCDPDGGGPLQECEGVCALRPGGIGGVSVACVTLATAGVTTNNGKICGSSGASDCSKQCSGKLCVALNAPDGAACRPSSGPSLGGSICDGQCVSGACVALTTDKCPANTTGDCTYDFCSATAAKTCVKYPLPKGYTCNDSNICTSGDSCDGLGKCVGTTKTCPASMTPCLINACEPTTTTGTCIAKPQAGVACAFDKCNAGTCSSTGTCDKGAPISCDDGDPCTNDSCDSATGCKHVAKCPSPDACTIAACDKTTGTCSSTARSCDDGNPCTADTCDATAGCKHTAIPGCTYIPDAAVPPTDTGVVEPTDTGVVIEPTDSGTTVEEDTGTTVEEDTGTATTTDSGSTTTTDSGSTTTTDAGEDAGAGTEETVDTSGCGCRTTNGAGTTAGTALSLAALGLVLARRRRSA